jgi:hypothetical protein
MLLGVGTAWAVNIEIEGVTIPPQGTGEIQVSVDPQGDGVVATLNDVQFPAGGEVVVTERTVTAALASDITADATEIPLEEGDADSLPSFGIVDIEGEEISYSGIDGDTLIVASRGGRCTVGGDPCVEDADCESGTCVGAAAHTAGTAVTVPTRVPECSATSDITNLNKEVVFSFLPDQCTPGTDCVGVRAIVIALDNLDEITSATSIYRCTVQTNQDTGEFPLVCPVLGGACTTDDDCEENETCNTTAGTCVPDAPFQPAQSGDSPLSEGQVGNLPTTCAGATVTVSETPSCVGDCGEPLGTVSLGEVQRAFRGFLTQDTSLCMAADANGMGGISLGEVQQSFRNFLAGACPG